MPRLDRRPLSCERLALAFGPRSALVDLRLVPGTMRRLGGTWVGLVGEDVGAMRVVLITWAKENDDRVAKLRGVAEEVTVVAPKGPPDLKELAADPPDAVVLDLDRRPSEGLVIAIQLRRQPATRRMPQVFAGGAPEKIERVRAILPDARYADWDGIATQLRTALERPPDDPIVPDAMAPYAGASLEQKLGLTGSSRVRLIDPPPELVERVETARQTDGEAELVVLCVRTPAELDERLQQAIESVTDEGSLWIAWPKGGKGARGELTQLVVRERGMAAGWVDYKIVSLDEIWSALRFRRRN
jgi:CheY-like chemotaxis protein